MTSTRITLSSATERRRESYTHFCPNCGSVTVRDGRLGNFNRAMFCDAACYSKYRALTLPGEYIAANVSTGASSTEIPPRVGDL